MGRVVATVLGVGVLSLVPIGRAPRAQAATPSQLDRLSVAESGAQGNALSTHPCLARGGRFVAFMSGASNLVPGDGNSRTDVFIVDRSTAEVEIASLANDGSQNPGGSNVSTVTPHCVSDSGRFVVFHSDSRFFVPGDTNNRLDVFVRDRVVGTTTRVSTGYDGAQLSGHSFAGDISADGRYVAFSTRDESIVGPGIYVRDLVNNTLARIGPGDNYPTLSADGRFVAFWSNATDIGGEVHPDAHVDAFVHDRDTDGDGVFDEVGAAATRRISRTPSDGFGNGQSDFVTVSNDGRYVTFRSEANNLVAGDTNGWADAFFVDRDADGDGVFDEADATTTRRVSVSASGTQSNGHSWPPSMSADGTRVVFASQASNLVGGDTNGVDDVFIVETTSGHASRRLGPPGGQLSQSADLWVATNASGQDVLFSTASPNLVPGDSNSVEDVFVERAPGPRRRATVAVARGQLIGRGGRHARNNTVYRSDP